MRQPHKASYAISRTAPDRSQWPDMQRDEFGVPTFREESQAVTARHREDLIRNNGLPIASEDLDRGPIHENMQLHAPILGW